MELTFEIVRKKETYHCITIFHIIYLRNILSEFCKIILGTSNVNT
jgi:hypothetical protein